MKAKDLGFIQEFDYARFSAHLKSKRRSFRWSLADLGKVVKKSAVTCSRWENQELVITTPDFLFICWLFDLEPMDYFQSSRTLPKTQLMNMGSGVREWEQES